MEEKDIDRIIRIEKEQESFDPPSFVWSDLEKDLRSRKKKRRFIVWWFIGLILVSSTSFYLVQQGFLDSENETSIADSSKIESHSDIDQTDFNRSNLNIEKDEKQEGIKHSNSPVSEKNLRKEKENIESLANNLNVDRRKNSDQNLDKVTTISRGDILIDESDSKNSMPSPSIETIAIPTFAIDNSINSKQPIANENPIMDKDPRDMVEIFGINELSFFIVTEEWNFKRLSPQIQKKHTQAKSSNSIIASLHFGKPIFSEGTSSNSILPTESDWYSYGLSLGYFRSVFNRLEVGGGISIRQSKRKFNYESEDLLLRNYELGSANLSESFEYGYLISQGEQRYTFIDFSAGFQYEIWSSGIIVKLGLLAKMNVKLSTEGKTLGINKEIIKYVGDDNFYQSSLGLGYSPYISLSFPIRENFYLTMIPSYTGYFQNLENESFNKNFTYSNLGIDLGVSRRF